MPSSFPSFLELLEGYKNTFIPLLLWQYSKKVVIEILCGTASFCLVTNEQREQTCFNDFSHIFVIACIPKPL